jgi:hypothetical protein
MRCIRLDHRPSREDPRPPDAPAETVQVHSRRDRIPLASNPGHGLGPVCEMAKRPSSILVGL